MWRINLLDGYKATATTPTGDVNGTWSTVYDQAMRVELDNGVRFLTNFRYNLKPDVSKDPVAEGAAAFSSIKTSDYDTFESKCNESMVGFVQKVHGEGDYHKHHAQCFYAKQVEALNIETS